MARKVQAEITQAIQQGRTLVTYKTKPQVGRKSVTVGPYRQAVGPSGFAVVVGAEANQFGTAVEAAGWFIWYVGRNEAWAALQGRGRQRNPQ